MSIYTPTKLCPKCGTPKPTTEFGTDNSRKDKLHPYCKECRFISKKTFRQNNAEKIRESKRTYYQENKETIKEKVRQYTSEHKEAKKERDKIYQRKNISTYVANNAKRKSSKLQATPKWCETEQIKSIYAQCKQLSEQTGIEHHVDHIVPLQSDIVCGLHCLANLQILTSFDNLSKGNYYWPDMP